MSLPHQSCYICLFNFFFGLLIFAVFLLFHHLPVIILPLLASGLTEHSFPDYLACPLPHQLLSGLFLEIYSRFLDAAWASLTLYSVALSVPKTWRIPLWFNLNPQAHFQSTIFLFLSMEFPENTGHVIPALWNLRRLLCPRQLGFVSESRDGRESIRLNLLIWLFQCICASVFGLPHPSVGGMLKSPPRCRAVRFSLSFCQLFLYVFQHYVLRPILYLIIICFWWMLFSISLYPYPCFFLKLYLSEVSTTLLASGLVLKWSGFAFLNHPPFCVVLVLA